MICTPHPMLFGLSNKKKEMGGSCSTYGGEERCMQCFGREMRPFGRPRCRWNVNIKMDLLEVGCGAWMWLSCLWIVTCGSHL